MEQKRRNPVVQLALWALVAVLAVVCFLVYSDTAQKKALRDQEVNASPSPTANTRSMLQVTHDPNNTPAPTSMVIKVGTKGDSVKQLQQRLQELGYYSGALDGQFGEGSRVAVVWFQGQHGLDADGVAGDATLTLLYSDQAQTARPTDTPAPSDTPSPTASSDLLKKGSSGDLVKALQQRLITLGYLSGEADGQFGGGTEEAVRVFQRQNGLDVDGAAGKATQTLLFSDEAKQVTVTPTPDPSDLPILVNEDHPVGDDYEPGDLVKLRNVVPSSVATIKGSDIQGDRTAVDALIQMFEAAIRSGVSDWQVSAGYRSYKYQKKLFDDSVSDYISQGRTKASAISATRLTVADPGASEHHTGLAFDITTPGTIFKGTQQQKWLAKNCWDYGFVIRYAEDKEKITGIIAECWHIRYVGKQHSLPMRDGNLCLEEYIQKLTK